MPPRMGMSLVESHTCCPTQYVGAGTLLLSARCFIRAEALMRLARVTLQVLLHHLTKACADSTPTSFSWLGKNGGWYPKQHSKGDILEAADVWLLIAYSTHGSCELQDTGLLAHRHLSTVSIDWLARSVWPLDWGWKPDDKLMCLWGCKMPSKTWQKTGDLYLKQCQWGCREFWLHV